MPYPHGQDVALLQQHYGDHGRQSLGEPLVNDVIRLNQVLSLWDGLFKIIHGCALDEIKLNEPNYYEETFYPYALLFFIAISSLVLPLGQYIGMPLKVLNATSLTT